MKTNAYILLDRSRSMESNWKETIGSINGYAERLQIDGNIMVATFDNISYDVIRNSTPENWKTITSEEVSPRGGTPLLDSAARIMHYALDSKTDRAIIVIITDGEENQSKNFTKSQVNSLTEEVKSRGYEVVFLGASFDKIGEVAQTVGNFRPDKFMAMRSGAYGQTMNMMAEKTALYASGAAATVSLSEEDKEVGKI